MSEKGYLLEINNAKPGNFICVDVSLSINSINNMIEEVEEIVKLLESIKKIDSSINIPDKSKMKDLKNVVKVLFGGQEVLFQKEDYAILSSVNENNLYQSSLNDIIDTELKCLAQVKRIYPKGTELMKNTIFSKFKDKKTKNSFIDKMTSFSKQDFYNFDVVVIPSIEEKPVYQIEIIALYQ